MVTESGGDCSEWLVSKGRINKLGKQLRSGAEGDHIEIGEQCYRLFRLESLPLTFRTLAEMLIDRRVLLSARLKRRRSLRGKLHRLRSINLSQIADVVGFRVVCEDVVGVQSVVDTIGDLSIETKIRRHDPAPTGYRAVHIELPVEQRLASGKTGIFTVEIQVRTYYQHLWALRSEAFGEKVKQGRGRTDQLEYLKHLSAVVTAWEKIHPERTQRRLPQLTHSGGIAVVRQVPIGGAPIVERFDLASEEAADQLTEWERLAQGDTLFLAYSGDINTIQTTHSVYMVGPRLGVPLESWMPRWEEAG